MATTLPYDQKAYSQYMDDLNNSQGFYVTPSEDGSALVGGVRPVKEYSDIHHYRKAELAAKFAVEEQNMKGRKHRWLKFIKIVHLNREPAAGAIYYITMAAADSYGEVSHYEAKVREKLNTGYILLLFRLAPYWVTNSDKLSNDCCCIGIDNLLPNMDESYFYYKCFYRARKEFLGVGIIDDEQNGGRRVVIWFKSCEESEEFMEKYQGKGIPLTNNCYHFNKIICPRFFYI